MSWVAIEVVHKLLHPNIAVNVAMHLNEAGIVSGTAILIENDDKGNLSLVGWKDEGEYEW